MVRKMEGLPMVIKCTSSSNEIITVIDSLASQNSCLNVTKSYRGIILSEDVKIISVNNQRAVLQTFTSKICAAFAGCIHLHSPAFPRPVKARVKDVCISEGMLALSDFTYLESDWKNRLSERVQPKQPTYGFLMTNKSRFRASLKNISDNGLGLMVSTADERERHLQTNSSIKLEFQITPEYKWTALRGRIVYLIKVSKSLFRLGIQLQPSTQQARKLQKYITLRKKEIMNELDQAFLAAIAPMGVECQYF